MSDFNAAIKKIQPAAKREGFATVPDVTWSDVGAMENVRKEIELKVLARVNDQEYAKELNLHLVPVNDMTYWNIPSKIHRVSDFLYNFLFILQG